MGGAGDSLITDFKLTTQLKMTLNSPTSLQTLDSTPRVLALQTPATTPLPGNPELSTKQPEVKWGQRIRRGDKDQTLTLQNPGICFLGQTPANANSQLKLTRNEQQKGHTGSRQPEVEAKVQLPSSAPRHSRSSRVLSIKASEHPGMAETTGCSTSLDSECLTRGQLSLLFLPIR